MNVFVNVVDQTMTATNSHTKLVSGTVEFIRFSFTFDEDWENLTTIAAQFVQNGVAYNQLLDSENQCYLPSEIGPGTFTMMIFGSGGEYTKGVSNYLTFLVDENSLIQDSQSTEITQSLYDQLVAKVNNLLTFDEQKMAELTKVDTNLQRQINAKAEQTDLDNEIARATAVESSINSQITSLTENKADKTEVEELSAEVSNFVNNSTVAAKIQSAVEDEMERYLNSGVLGALTIGDGTISEEKLDSDLQAKINDLEGAMLPSIYDPQGLQMDIFAYAKARADSVNTNLTTFKNELAENYYVSNTHYSTLKETIAGVISYNEQYTQSLLLDYKAFTIKIVDSLPLNGEEMTFYLLPNKSNTGYDKYWWIKDTDGTYKYDTFGSSSTLVVTELPTTGDVDVDYILRTDSGCLYYKWIDNDWEVVAGSIAVVLSELPDTGSELNDYYILNKDNGVYVHYRWINGKFREIGTSSYTQTELDLMFDELKDDINDTYITPLSSRVSQAETNISTIENDLTGLSSAVADVTVDSNAIKVTYMDGEEKTLNIETGTDIGGWYVDDENYLHLLDAEDQDIIDAVKLPAGGGGTVSGGTATITRVTSSNVECILGDSRIIEYTFSALDSAGDMVGTGTGTWSVNGIIKATTTVYQGANSFDIGEYLSSGSNTVKLSVQVDTGGDGMTTVTKTWSVNAVNMYFVWSYDDSQINTAAISDRWTPYGDISKTTHTIMDGVELATSTTTRSGVQQSMLIEMQSHGAHMVERYITATVGSTEIQTASQFHEMIFVESGNNTPIIACSYGGATVTQYNTVALPIVIYDPSSLTANATLAVDGEVIATWTNIDRTVHYWNYTPTESGTKTLTVTVGSVTKTITIPVEELDLDIEEVSGYAFRFKASEMPTNDSVQSWSSNGVTMTFSDNFDWINGGIQSETDENGNIRQYFCVKAGTTATINYQLFSSDAKRAGKNFKFIYKAVNCRKYDASVLSCMNAGIGLEINAQNACLYTEQNTLETLFCKDTYMEFEFNIHPTSEQRYLQFWMDGCPDREVIYASNDNTVQSSPQYITIGSSDCDVYVYLIKSYDYYLTNDNICTNYITDASNAFDMVERYESNDILNESGEISYQILSEKMPGLRVLLFDVPRMTNGKKDTVTGVTWRQIYNEGGQSHCFTAYNCELKGQGTSSENYGDSARNLDVKATEGFQFDDGTTASKYAMTDNSFPENYFNIKLNVASSENANNARIANWYNDHQCWHDAYLQREPKARDCMEFHAAVVFIRDQSQSLVGFEDGEYHLYGIADFGNSKKNTDVFHDPENPLECCVEVSNNTNALCLMKSKDFSTEAYDGKGSFEFRYPSSPTDAMKAAWERFVGFMYDYHPGLATGNALSESVTFQPYTFVGDGSDSVLAGLTISEYAGTYTHDTYEYRMAYMLEHCEEYMIMDAVVFHYVFIESFGMIDNMVKNTFWSSSDLIHWHPAKNYDNDTACGNDNEGGMTISYGTETDDTKGDGHAFNGYDCAWGTFVRGLYDARQRMYQNRESAGTWDTESFLADLDDYQSLRPERLWVADFQRKYNRPYEGEGTTGYIDMIAGKKTHQRRQFVTYNQYYFSSCYVSSKATSELITVRCYTPTTWSGVEPKNTIDLTMYADCYIVVRSASTTVRTRAKRGQTYTMDFSAAGQLNDTETYFYLAPMIQKIGDMAHLYIGYSNFSYATMLQELSVGSSASGYTNNNLTSISFGSNTMLEYLQIQNCPNVKSDLDLTGCQALKTLLVDGSGFTGIALATGALIETLHIPSPNSLILRELIHLTDFTYESLENLTSLRMEGCTTIDSKEFIELATNMNRLRVTGVDWVVADTTLLDRLYTMNGMDEQEYTTDTSVVAGQVTIPVIGQGKLTRYNTVWPNLLIIYTTLIAQYEVAFYNMDGTPLKDKSTGEDYIQLVDRGSTPYDPVDAGEVNAPAMAADEQYTYTWTGWDNITASVLNNSSITATYTTTVRYYDVKFYDIAGGTVLENYNVPYGSDVVYQGDTPTLTNEESNYVYKVFAGWDKSTGFIKSNLNVYAIWDRGELPAVGTDLSVMTPGEIYAVVKANKASDYWDYADWVEINMGHDFDFSNVESKTVISSETYFDGATCIDTGVTLFGEDDPSFTLAIDYEFEGTNSNSTLLSCFDPDRNAGFRLRYSGGPNVQWGDVNTGAGASTLRNMTVIRHQKGSRNLYVYVYNTNASNWNTEADTVVKTYLINRTKDPATDYHLLLGAIQYSDGVKDDYGTGYIHWCKIWFDDLGVTNCQKLAQWPHETWRVEYTGTRRYRIAGSSSYAGASFLPTQLLPLTKRHYPTDDNTGGWDLSEIRTFFNNRLPEILPQAWKSMLKKVRISASDGNQSTAITVSEDYFYLPAYAEMTTVTSSPYVDEGTVIPWFTTNQSRVKWLGLAPAADAQVISGTNTDPVNDVSITLKEGDVWYNTSGNGYIWHRGKWSAASNTWWLRSPYATSSASFWFVNASGNLSYGYGASPTYGLCPGFSIGA